MGGNDQWGDCVIVEAAHHVQSVARYGSDTAVMIPDPTILAAYSDLTGFDPAAGPPGANPTDQGTVMQDAQSYWRKHGLGGHRSVVFAAVDVHDLDEVCAAIDLFGAVAVGIAFPASAMDQFNAGQDWTVTVPDGGIDGGHAVHVAGYDRVARTFTVTTWGRVISMSWDFWRTYTDEAWVPIFPEWVDAAGRSPTGLDLHGLGADFAALTGQPNPWPTPTPTPVPVPVPDPPSPGPRPFLWSLWSRLWSTIRRLIGG
jgi:hypothetical protein